MDKTQQTQSVPVERRSALERLDDLVTSVNPDIWLFGAVFAVIAPWLNYIV